jgi:hypothetical protein
MSAPSLTKHLGALRPAPFALPFRPFLPILLQAFLAPCQLPFPTLTTPRSPTQALYGRGGPYNDGRRRPKHI